MQKHILLYSDDPGVGEVAQYNHMLLCGLTALGYRLTCVQSPSSSSLINTQKQLGITHVWLEFDTTQELVLTISNQFYAKKIFEIAQPDLIIISDTWPLANSGVKQVAIQLGIPFIVVVGLVDSLRAEELSKLVIHEMSRYYHRAEAVIALSTENLNLLNQKYGLPEHKGQVIHPGISAKCFAPSVESVRDRLRQELNIPLDAVICLTSAPLELVKGYQYQLAAIQKLKQTEIWNSLYFIWVGSGTFETQLRLGLNQLEIADRVKIAGQRSDILNLLETSDIFILTSIEEGMPLAIIEAMAKGLPVVATAVGGVPEQLGDIGKLLPDPKIDPHATINELLTTIQDWSTNPELRHSIGQASKTRAEHFFKEERMIQETHVLIKNAFHFFRVFRNTLLKVIRQTSNHASLFKRASIEISRNQFIQNFLENNVNFCQYLMGIGSASEVISSGEEVIFDLLQKRFEAPYCIFDVGSNKGQFLRTFLEKITTDNFSIHCFEPAHETFKILTNSSKKDQKIKLNNLGIGKEKSKAVLHYNAIGSGLASLTKRQLDHIGIGFEKSEFVLIDTIDNYCLENHINHIHLLKIDIEGHELDALAGARQMFADKSIDIVTFEFGGCNIDTRSFFRDFWYFFREVNMKLFRITPSGYLYPIESYKEAYEQFTATTFVALTNR